MQFIQGTHTKNKPNTKTNKHNTKKNITATKLTSCLRVDFYVYDHLKTENL